MQKLILASSSPRRKELLNQINITPSLILSPEIDESIKKDEPFLQYSKRMSFEKANKIYQNNSDSYIIAADTMVCTGRKILAKANNDDDVRNFLQILSGKQHSVISSFCVIAPNGKLSNKAISSKVKFKRISNIEIGEYISSKEGIGKAGGYAIQGLAGKFVKRINGSYSAIICLPLYEISSALVGLGYKKDEV